MMEFTYDGMVRFGFGFYNPNHAAALFAALLPFLWAAWEKFPRAICRIPVAAATLALFAALALTYSRTGALIVFFELLLFFFAYRQKTVEMRQGALLLAVFLALLILCGAMARFTIDRAATNRLAIYQAGAALFAANPLGVGHGNSGAIATAFLLPGRIACRTLVNSHLTLLAEYGAVIGFLWFGTLFYALMNGFRRRAAWIALAGLTLSALSASIFDWQILFDLRDAGGLPRLNQILAWLLLLFYLGLIAFNARGRFRPGIAGIAAGTAALLLVTLALTAPGGAPKARGEFLLLAGADTPLVLYDRAFTLRECAAFLPEGGALPLAPAELRTDVPLPKSRTVFLFGECAHFARRYPDATVTLISPPPYFTLPDNVHSLHLKRYGDNDALLRQAEKRQLTVVYY